MKATIYTTLIKAVFIAILILSPIALEAQTGKVWTKIADINALALTVNADKTLSTSNAELNNLIQNLEITTIEKAFPASRSKELMDVYEISCNCDEIDLLQGISARSVYFQNPEIASAPEVLYTPNDYTQAFPNDYALNLINAQDAWDVSKGDSSIVIAITDANFHLNHSELIGKYNYVSPNTSADYVHGTAVAITAAGNTNNGIGKSSIGFNSTLQLRAMNYDQVLEASYAGARIVNMSWTSGCYLSFYAQLVLDEAHANGTILVASAGNGSTCGGPNNLVYPAAYNHVIAVSSVGPFDNHERTIGNPATTHQHNNSVDICAPGYDVALSIAEGNYLTGNGTSFAAPFVSGTIALMLAVNPCLTSEEVEYILKQTAVNIYDMNPAYIGKLGAGRLDAGAAVLMASKFQTMQNQLQSENTFICSTMEQGIVLDLSTVQAPYQVAWSTGSTDTAIADVEPGNYFVVVRDGNGCVGYMETVIDTLIPIAISADLYPVMCHGENSGNIEISVVGGQGTYTYQWTNGATSDDLYNLNAGIYTVTVTDGKGCSASEEYLLNQPDLLDATVVHQDFRYNQAGFVDVTVNGGSYPYTFSWNNGENTEDVSELNPGFYEVLITDAKGCLASANAIVNALDADNLNTSFANSGNFSESEVIAGSARNTLIVKSQTMGLNDANLEIAMEVYPNPASDYTNVSWNEMNVQKVQLLDLSGKIIRTIEVQDFTNSIVISNVSTGEYLVKLLTVEGGQLVKKVSFL